MDVFQFLAYDELQACRKMLPRWEAVISANERLMPREPLQCVRINSHGNITAETDSVVDVDSSSSPGEATSSKASGKGGEEREAVLPYGSDGCYLPVVY